MLNERNLVSIASNQGWRWVPTLSEETAHPTVYQHHSQLSVDIQAIRLIKFREDLGVQIQLTQVIFRLG